MITALFNEALQACLAVTLAVTLLLALRKTLRRWLGAEATYRFWMLVPASILAVWLPGPVLRTDAPAIPVYGLVGSVDLGLISVAPTADTATWLQLAWVAGAIGCALLFAARQHRFTRRIRRQPLRAFDIVDSGSPAVVGAWRPRIVLPADFDRHYTPEEQRLVLAHEQAHVSRGDLLAQAFALVLRCMFWFNPFVHVGARRFGFDQELACDAAVLAKYPRERRVYADAMLKTHMLPFALPMACHWQSRHPLKERITMLKHPLPGPGRRLSGRLAFVSLLALGSYAAWAAQPAQAPLVNATATSNPAASPAPAKPEGLTRLFADEDLSPPVYPPKAKAEGITGNVLLEVVFGADGHARKVTVVSATPAGFFEQAAVDAANKWRLRPGFKDGQPVERTYRIPVQFSLPVEKDSAAAGQ